MCLFFLENNIVAIILWLAIFLITISIELSTSQLVSIWFSGGAAIALILACFDVNWIIQICVFLGISTLLVVSTRPFIRKKIKSPDSKTNADSLINSEILITHDVSKQIPGEGKVRDVIWTVKTNEDVEIKEGEYAIVKEIKGNHLIVTKKGNK